MPKVSIYMPCYNAAATLDEALISIHAQTFTDWELVAVDDGSTDSTGEILQRWAVHEPRMRVISRPHEGVIGAANAGLQACTGQYIARMDADDRMLLERLEKQAAWLDAHPGTSVVSCQVRGFGRVRQGFAIYLEWLNGLLSNEDIRREMFVELPLPNPSVMFRRELLDTIGLFEEHGWPEDYDYWLRAYSAGLRFEKVPEVLYEWCEHPHRLTRTDSRYSVENFIRAKVPHLISGPLAGRDAVIIWGAGMMGRRISKHLLRAGAPIVVFVDIDQKKIGSTRRGKPIIAPEDLPGWWVRYQNPVLLAAVGARGARQLIRERLAELHLVEGRDWWGVA